MQGEKVILDNNSKQAVFVRAHMRGLKNLEDDPFEALLKTKI